VAILSGGRFTLGIGAGDRLNEHVVGRPFPAVRKRHEAIREALEIIRLLWRGGYQPYDGRHLQLEDARVFDLPETLPLMPVAAGGPLAAAIAAELGDGLFATEPKAALVQAYRDVGGAGPCYAEVPLAWAPDADTAAQAVLDTMRWAVTGWKVMSELPNPVNFAAATTTVTADDIKAQFACGPDVDRHLEVARQFADAASTTSSCRTPVPTRRASPTSSAASCPGLSGP
jgi:G6PDH family F420-dependent oxidoreductase